MPADYHAKDAPGCLSVLISPLKTAADYISITYNVLTSPAFRQKPVAPDRVPNQTYQTGTEIFESLEDVLEPKP